MDIPDIARTLLTYLDDERVRLLVTSGVITYSISASSDQRWWHDQVEALSGVKIAFDPAVSWDQTHRILKRELERKTPRFHNRRDNVTVLKLLLAMGFIPESKSLSIAAEKGLTRTLAFLLDEGSIDPNEPVETYPPLTLAADMAQVEAVRLLLSDPRVDPNNRAGDTTALTQACSASISANRDRYIEIVRLLLEDGRADPQYRDSIALSAPTELGDDVYEIVQLLLSDGRANPDDDDGAPFIRTVENGAEKCLTVLLQDERTRPWTRNGQALLIACENSYVGIVKLLLEDGRIDPNSSGGAALLTCVNLVSTEKSIAMIGLLLSDSRTYAAIDNNAALIDAIKSGDAVIVEMLLENDDVLTELDNSALIIAQKQSPIDREIVNLIRDALERR